MHIEFFAPDGTFRKPKHQEILMSMVMIQMHMVNEDLIISQGFKRYNFALEYELFRKAKG